MSQSSLPLGQPEEPTPVPAPPEVVADSDGATSTSVTKLGRQKKRSSEQQAEVERIGQIEPFVGLERDERLFTALNQWRELGICARVITIDRLGLAKSLKFYTHNHTKRRSGLLVTPSPVIYVEIEQHGCLTDLFVSIGEFLAHPFYSELLPQLRSRTLATLKSYKVKLLIINNADMLSFAAFNELIRIAEKLRISVVLAGSPYLNEILEPRGVKKNKYINIYNTFLKFHHYNVMNKEDLPTVILEWEKKVGWSQPLKLWADKDIVATLDDASQGQLRALYDNLREVAVWKIDHPQAQSNSQNISTALGRSYRPISKL
jgi:hypothetical protein